MSKRGKNNQKKVQEPWEQSIYEPDQNGRASRLEKRQQKKGNTFFLTILVILLLLIITLPIGTYFWATRDNKPDTSKNVTQSSSVVSSSSAEAKSTSETETSAPEASETETEQATNQRTEESQTSVSSSERVQDSQEDGTGTSTTVQNGEGPQQVAERNGLTIEQLLQLNPTMNSNTMLYPGDKLRIK